jgi:HK97 family phage major capsid protein
MSEHPNVPEQRTVDVDVQALDTRGRTLHGYAAVYGAESRDLGGFTETIAPGAFANVLGADVRALLNHDASQVLGRTRAGTLRLADEQRGLKFEVDLPDSPLGENVREAVRRGDIDGASFRFVVDQETWDGDKRTIVSVKDLQDVTVATYGAYPEASVELRTQPDPTPEPQENIVKTEDRTEGGGGLAVEDRTAAVETASVEHRVIDALRSVPRGENRALTTSASVSPGELATFLFDKLRASSVALSSGITVLTTDKDSVVYPALTGDVAPGWFAEAAPITPGDPTFSTVTATPRKLAHLVQMSNEVIDDSDPSIVDVLNTHLLAMLALKLDVGVFEGTGTAPEVRGLANVTGIQTVDAGANGAQPTLDLVADAIGLLEAVNTAATAIVMGPRTFAKLRKVKDTTGAYLLAAPTAATGRQLFGVPVYVSAQLSTTEPTGTAGNVGASIYVYNAAQVVYVRRHDVELELDRSRLFNSDQSELRAKARGDLIVPNPSAVVRVTHVL